MNRNPKSVIVVGASRGIGAAVAQHFAEQNHHVFSVSRTQPPVGQWIPADISTPAGIQAIGAALGRIPLDALLFMGGVWEQGAFTADYDFCKSSDSETRWVLSVNTIAPIEITRLLVGNLAAAPNPRAIYIGSLSGIENGASVEVANTASKFGLRGAVQALRLALKDQKIGFSVINPGNVGTEEVMLDIQEGRFLPQEPIPLSAIVATLEWLLNLPRAVDVPDVNLWQRA